MAIQLEFIDLVVPRSVIEAMYPGGWDGCLSDHRSLIGGRVWFDEYLFRDGAMNPTDIKALVTLRTYRFTFLVCPPAVFTDKVFSP